MGVRARIAEWPPKREVTKEAAGGHRDAAGNRDGPANHDVAGNRVFPGGQQPPAGVSGFKALHRLARRRSKEVEFQEGWPRPSPAKGWAPLRHRSSSEVTLSECDPEEPAEAG
ncbi:SI1L3 protein, partial [Halcyon senegalensis]|nr:SI1L3 protein [Halcyon senegalensis]